MRPAIHETTAVVAGSPVSQDQRIGFGMTDKGQSLEVHHLALIPADQGYDLSQTGQLALSGHHPHVEILLARNRGDVPDLRRFRRGEPSIGELKAAAHGS